MSCARCGWIHDPGQQCPLERVFMCGQPPTRRRRKRQDRIAELEQELEKWKAENARLKSELLRD